MIQSTTDNVVPEPGAGSDFPGMPLGSQYDRRASPILKLPSEVLLLIFEHYVAAAEDSWDNPSSQCFSLVVNSPWILSKISHQWRNISISSAKLWTSIHFAFYSLTTAQTNLLSLHLARSKGLPLSIQLCQENAETTGHPEPAPQDLFVPLRRLLLHQQRWKSLKLEDTSEGDALYRALLVLSMSSGPMKCPNLVHLVTEVSSFLHEQYFVSDEWKGEMGIFALDGLPSLKSLSIRSNGAMFDQAAPLPSFPWHQLERLVLSDIQNLDDIFGDTKLSMNNLTYLELVECSWWPDPPPDGLQALLPSLRTIYVVDSCTIFPLFVTPALENITTDWFSDREIEAISKLIDRSQCSIRTFRCNLAGSVDSGGFRSLLETMNMLEDLLVDFSSSYGHPLPDIHTLAEWLGVMEDNSFSCCPRLRHLSLHGHALSIGKDKRHSISPPPLRDLSPIINALELRSAFAERSAGRIVFGLQRVDLFHDEGWEMESDSEIAERVSALREAGMDIVARPMEDMVGIMHWPRSSR